MWFFWHGQEIRGEKYLSDFTGNFIVWRKKFVNECFGIEIVQRWCIYHDPHVSDFCSSYVSLITMGISISCYWQDHIHQLTVIEQKMVWSRFVLKRFRHFNHSGLVSDLELQDFVSDLLKLGEVPIKTSGKERPSDTRLGKLIYQYFLNGCKVISR